MTGTIEEDILLLAHRSDQLFHQLSNIVQHNRRLPTSDDGGESQSSMSMVELPVEQGELLHSKKAQERQVARLHILLNALSLARNRYIKTPPSSRKRPHGAGLDVLQDV